MSHKGEKCTRDLTIDGIPEWLLVGNYNCISEVDGYAFWRNTFDASEPDPFVEWSLIECLISLFLSYHHLNKNTESLPASLSCAPEL